MRTAGRNAVKENLDGQWVFGWAKRGFSQMPEFKIRDCCWHEDSV
ncbi:MAG: hypothetical protein ACYS67_16075 [Planctomycetota bacterium]